MIFYEHRQPATAIILSILPAIAIIILLGLTQPPPKPLNFMLISVLTILVVCAILFFSLTIRITETELRWHFGPGLIRKKAALAVIQQAEITTTKFIHGWGIHLTPQGWLYNVSGFKAVAFKLKNGKQFVLGTDEPEKLHDAIKNVTRGSGFGDSEGSFYG
jgi:hypothetical protein